MRVVQRRRRQMLSLLLRRVHTHVSLNCAYRASLSMRSIVFWVWPELIHERSPMNSTLSQSRHIRTPCPYNFSLCLYITTHHSCLWLSFGIPRLDVHDRVLQHLCIFYAIKERNVYEALMALT